MTEVIVGIAVGIATPILLGMLHHRRMKADSVSNFLVVELTCSKCGHHGAIVKTTADTE
jgi:hypothetical protein